MTLGPPPVPRFVGGTLASREAVCDSNVPEFDAAAIRMSEATDAYASGKGKREYREGLFPYFAKCISNDGSALAHWLGWSIG